ncbi:MAG: sporulation integral membrane protein YtvI [Firmicutes bacterium HGW-Firmicutes-14]|nr:MAG: sporulation integral membrane protein YtvI [Firmicutes bacterium HGW-Firmicutes-14]
MIHPIVKLVFTLIGLVIFYYLFPHLLPFLVALVLAVLFEPVVHKLHLVIKGKRGIAVTINFVAFVVVAGILTFLGSTKIINELMGLSQQLPDFAVKVGQGIEDLILRTQIVFEDMPAETIKSLEETIREAVDMSSKISAGAAALIGTASAIPEMFVIIIVTLVSFYLFSLQLPDLRTRFLNLFSERAREKIIIILMDVNKAIIGFVRAQLIISLLTYFFIVAGLLFLDIRYALAIALLIILVDVLPILGTGFIMLPWAGFLFLMGERFTAMGIVVLYVLIIVFRRILEPKILGENIGLSPLTTVISMYVGFQVLGVMGIFLGPAVCIIFKAMRKAGLFQQKLDF